MATPAAGTPVKVSFLWNQGVMGWSDTFYFCSTTNDPLIGAKEAAIKLAQSTLQMRSNKTLLAAIRLTSLGADNGKTLLVNKDIPGGSAGKLTQAEELPGKGWLMRLAAGNGTYSRHVNVRGIIAVDNTYTSVNQVAPEPKPAFALAAGIYLGYLNGTSPDRLAGSWVIRAIAKEAPPRVVSALSSVTVDPTTKQWVVKQLGANPAVGQKIWIQRAKGCGTAGLNGMHTVVGVGPLDPGGPAITLADYPKCTFTPTWKPGTGVFITSVYQFYSIDVAQIERITTKKVGRAFFSTRGRRSPTKC